MTPSAALLTFVLRLPVCKPGVYRVLQAQTDSYIADQRTEESSGMHPILLQGLAHAIHQDRLRQAADYRRTHGTRTGGRVIRRPSHPLRTLLTRCAGR